MFFVNIGPPMRGTASHQERADEGMASGQRSMQRSHVTAHQWTRSFRGWGCTAAILMSIHIDGSKAQELKQPQICSASTAASGSLRDICEVMALADGRNKVKINLTAQSEKTLIAGYSVVTEHYNDSYLAPVVEAMPGDTVAARLVNRLARRPPSDAGHAAHGPANENPTNLHYFHGGVVTPKNARPPDDASKGNGDNVFVYLKNGMGTDETTFSFEYEVPIPGKNELDARVLEGDGSMEHPSGLNWYHSHLHGRSSDQVMGGLSGLLSVGDAKANVVAACRRDPVNQDRCLNDVAQETADLKARTDVRYAFLRDISLKNISALPEAAGDKTAEWAPEDKDWPENLGKCRVWVAGQPKEEANLRKGFCQRDERSAWLFTVNGQRFPTITVAGGRNLLLRLGNLSPNVAYWLELSNEENENDKLRLTLLSIDGVVPAKPVDGTRASQPVAALAVPDLLFMPASRAEVYVQNDRPQPVRKVYTLKTKGLIAGRRNDEVNDRWPEIQLARIVLEPTGITSPIDAALNAVAAMPRPRTTLQLGQTLPAVQPQRPDGCVPDMEPAKGEHRRVTFRETETTSDGRQKWGILTEIVQPPAGTSVANPAFESTFTPDPQKTVGIKVGENFRAMPFEEYDLGGGAIDWSKLHVCIHIDSADTSHKGSHKQLWVLVNKTGALHNFHIHQMKFRLATADELKTGHKINLDNEPSHTCPNTPAPCQDPDYKLYDDGSAGMQTKWHDTIPMPPGDSVYIIMSFDASQQIGRYVFHCHILKHEDNGLMAPIEVWTQALHSAHQ